MRTAPATLLWFCKFLLLLATGVNPLQGEEPPGGRISGTVRDAATAALLADVRVALEELHRYPPVATLTTDEDGRFVFSGIPRGTYTLCARKLGFVSRCWPDHPHFGTEIHVTSEEVYEELDIDLPRAAGAKGFVYDEDGEPVVEGIVFFKPLDLENDATYHVVTKADGSFLVLDLPPASYRISARRFSKSARQVVGEEWFYPGLIDPAESEAVSLREGEVREIELRFGFAERAVARDATWIGRVADEEGQPVAGVDLVLRLPEDNWQTPGACRTDEEGECRLDGIPAGEYWASTRFVPAPSAPWRDLEQPRGERGRYARRVLLEDGGLSETEFRLSSGLRIEIFFRHADGSPLAEDPGLTVFLRSLEGPGEGPQERFPEFPGVMLYHGLTAGEGYHLYLRTYQPFARYCVTGLAFEGGRLGSLADERLDGVMIEPERSPLRLIMSLSATATLHGRSDKEGSDIEVERIGGPPLPDGLYSGSQEWSLSRVRNGRFFLRGLPPGRYRIGIGGLRTDSTFEVELRAGEELEVGPPRARK